MQTIDPRATVIRNVAEEQQILQQVIKQIPPLQQITFDKLIESFDKCFEIRQQPQFIQAIFNKTEIYQQFVGWILSPLSMIQKREKGNKKVPTGNWKQKYPYSCMSIAKQNPAFYQNLYIKAYLDENAIWSWFHFLKDEHLETFDTSLGYFLQIMIPFIKYQFSQSSKICDILADSISDDSLVSSSEFQRQETSVEKQRKKVQNEKKRCYYQQQISILRIFSDELIHFIIKYIEHQVVFKFVHNLVLASLEETDLKRSKRIFQQFLKRSLSSRFSSGISIQKVQKASIMDICNQYILQILNEIYQNANTDKNYRVIFFVDSMVRLQLVNSYVDRIQNSFLITKQAEQRSSASMDFNAVIGEEQVLEYYLKSLSLLIKIYSKMVKNKQSQEEVLRQSKFVVNENQEDIGGQNKVMKQFASQIDIIFLRLPELSGLVKKNLSKSLPFSSGQNIKPITLCKYEFFQLIYNCLILARQYPQNFIVDTEKINIFSIIEKYLAQNRWNNIAHKILQKIAYLLIVNNKNFFRTKQMNRNNMADQFLNSIIQNFTNRNYIFLNSFRFTAQGNIHTLYIIAKAIIYELNQSHKLANFIHQIDYYKKFVMNDLQAYQTKTFEIKYPADEDDIRKSDRTNEDDVIKLEVDELSIKEIVKKIDIINKWPVKQSKRKHGSAIHRSLSFMSDDFVHPTNMQSSTGDRLNKNIHPSQSYLAYDDSSQFLDNVNGKRLKLGYKTPRDKFKSMMTDSIQQKSSLSGNGNFSIKKTAQEKKEEYSKGLFVNKDKFDTISQKDKQLEESRTLKYSPDNNPNEQISIHISGSGEKKHRFEKQEE